jgi:hypothetical protein
MEQVSTQYVYGGFDHIAHPETFAIFIQKWAVVSLLCTILYDLSYKGGRSSPTLRDFITFVSKMDARNRMKKVALLWQPHSLTLRYY